MSPDRGRVDHPPPAATAGSVRPVGEDVLVPDDGDPLVLLYFGDPWPGLKALKYAVRVSTPLCKACVQCGEQIQDGDRGFVRATIVDSGTYDLAAWPGFAATARAGTCAIHIECEALGIVGHTYGVCACTGFDVHSREAGRILWQRLTRRYDFYQPTMPTTGQSCE